MRPLTVFRAVLIPSALGFSSGILAGSCNLPLPCSQNVTISKGKPAFSITNTDTGAAGIFTIKDPTSKTPALVGRTNSTADNAFGVVGRITSTSSGSNSAGVFGINLGSGNVLPRIGVWGQSDAAGSIGVLGQSVAGTAVSGLSTSGIAVSGQSTFNAIVGVSTGGIGVLGRSTARGVVGTQGPPDISCPITIGDGNTAVGGCANTGTGMYGHAFGGVGVFGESESDKGVWGNGNGQGRGVVGTVGRTSCAAASTAGYGVGGCAADGDGVVGRSTNGRAGVFVGNVVITGNLSKGGGSFKIDHPVDPENKYLYHSFVESSDMLSLYTGNAVLDRRGAATVDLPQWFGALNRDFRYNLTAVGAPAPNLHVAEQVKENRFRIAGGQPGMTVSWQVTGVRQDPYANMNRIPVEEAKPPAERGKYLHPLAYGKPETMGVTYAGEPPPAVASIK